MSLTEERITWLLDNDPALRWQVERDIIGAPEDVWRATRDRVVTEGFGTRLLALQDPDGQWAGGAYFPGRRDERAIDPRGDTEADQGQPWTATTWSLNALREWGLDAAALGDTAERIAANSRWEYDDLPYWGGEVDCCINGYTLANGTWLGADVAALAGWFPAHQLADGGWNCEWENGATRSSVHSTFNALEGLLFREEHLAAGGQGTSGDVTWLRETRHRGEAYLLERDLFRRLSTGQPVGGFVSEFGYPFRWRYNVLRAAEYFRRAAALDGAPPDPRLADAIELIRAKRQPDGTWRQDVRHQGQVWFEVDVPVGEPSPWLTLFGTRVLLWWDDARP